ncbi:MAG: T9SS C-terminal target domain-containing protein [Flavobacteriales bacterium]|nr:T9SS C-terminal target domain-containing protein [Crocinitomicaceae bacterium]NBX78928.1 T9SS C-terminal target domain-containing protein [Flavobacteriales bacterium]NCA20104.1 T9SS C-terminal target domain-containing protein [Crocinitomicaceae bacterium]
MKVVLLMVFLAYSNLFAQNLVYNGGFEELTQCPDFPGQIEYAYPWYNPSGSDPDVFNKCAINPDIQVPNYYSGSFQNSRTGFGMMGINVWDNFFLIRESIQQKIKKNLVLNTTYCISLYVNLANPVRNCIDNLGIHLSKDSINCSPAYCVLGVVPQVRNPINFQICDTMNWTLIKGIYKADGTERYISIGNLQADSLTNGIVFNPNSQFSGAYYYFDDISITECRPPVLASDTLIDEGQNVIIGDTSQDVANYFWSPSVGLACDTCWQTTASPTETTTYTLTKITPCDTTRASITIAVTPTPPIPDFHFTLKPNPSSNFIELGFGFLKLESTVKIYDLQGRLVLKQNIPKEIENYTIAIQHLATGQYTLVFENSEFFVRKRVTKI